MRRRFTKPRAFSSPRVWRASRLPPPARRHCQRCENCRRAFKRRLARRLSARCHCSETTALQAAERVTQKRAAHAAWSRRHRMGCAFWTGAQADPASRSRLPSTDSGTTAAGERRDRVGGRANGPSGGGQCVLRCPGTADRWWRARGGYCSSRECGDSRVPRPCVGAQSDPRQQECAATHRPAPPHGPISAAVIAVAMPARRSLTPRNNP